MVSSWFRRQFWTKLIYLLYWKSWMHSTGPVFCQNQGPRSLILYDFRFSNLQNKGPTVTVRNFIILKAFFQIVTGTWPGHIFMRKWSLKFVRFKRESVWKSEKKTKKKFFLHEKIRFRPGWWYPRVFQIQVTLWTS